MARTVRAGLIQCSDAKSEGSVKEIQEAMFEKHLPFLEQAAQRGVQVLCLQEVFNGPYFCPAQTPDWYDAAEPVPGPTTERLQKFAAKHQMVLVVPVYEREMAGVYYNTAAVIDADGTYLGKYRKNHIPQTAGFWEKYYFKPGNLGYPVFKTRYATVGVYICYDRHFPEGARALGLNGAEIVLIPSATSRGLSEYLWRVEQVSHSLANGYFVGTINRVGIEKEVGDDDFYGQSYFVDPLGQFIGPVGSPHDEELLVRDLDLDLIEKVRQTWQFYRDRRPDAYDDLTRA